MQDVQEGGGDHPATDTTFVVVNSDDKILMQYRNGGASRYPDAWALPGTHIEQGQTAAQSIAMGATQKFGLRIPESDWHPVTQYFHDTDHDAVMIARLPEEQNPTLYQGDGLRWMTLEDLLEIDSLPFGQERILDAVEEAIGMLD